MQSFASVQGSVVADQTEVSSFSVPLRRTKARTRMYVDMVCSQRGFPAYTTTCFLLNSRVWFQKFGTIVNSRSCPRWIWYPSTFSFSFPSAGFQSHEKLNLFQKPFTADTCGFDGGVTGGPEKTGIGIETHLALPSLLASQPPGQGSHDVCCSLSWNLPFAQFSHLPV